MIADFGPRRSWEMAACALLRTEVQKAPLLVEMTSYHAPGGEFATGRFWGPERGESEHRDVSGHERDRKLFFEESA